MNFGRVESPISPRHTGTAGYLASDLGSITEGGSVVLYTSTPPAASGLGLEEAPSRSSGYRVFISAHRGDGGAAARVRESLRQPPIEVSLDEVLEAEGDSV